MSIPRRRRRDREPLNQTAGTLATVPTAMGDIPNAVETFAIKPTHEDIARRAHQVYEEREREHGRDQEDWFQAECELRQFINDAVGKILTAEGSYAVA